MKANNYYKHVNNTDVAFVPSVVMQGEKDLRVFGTWVNIVDPNNVYSIDVDELIINLSDLKKWERIDVSS